MERLHIGGRHVGDVRHAVADRLDLAGVEVDPGGVEAGFGEFYRERQADVAQADHAGAGAAGTNLFTKGLRN